MKRIGIDGGLLLFLIGAMCCPFSPKTGHEAAGVAFFFIAAAHVYENRGWLRSLAKGQSPFLTVPRLLNLLLGLTLLAVTVTGVLIFNYLFADLWSRELRQNILLHQLHRSLPYLFLILAGLHLGLHWRGLWQRFTRFCQWNTASPVYRALSFSFAAGIVAFGLYGSFANRLGDRILMKHIFATPALQSGAPFMCCCSSASSPLRGDSHDGRGMVGAAEIEKARCQSRENKL